MKVRTAPLAQCIIDERWLIVDVDDAYLELLGRPRAEVVGRSPLEFTAPQDQAFNDALLQRLDREGSGFVITKRYIRGDGAVQWVCNHVSAFGDGAGPRRIIATCSVEREPILMGGRQARARQDAANLARIFATAKHGFGDDLIGSPALEALLQLHLAEMEGRSLTTRGMARLIGQAPSTTLRWMRVLEQRGLIEVERDMPLDLAAPLRIGAHAQRTMETIAATLPPFGH